MFFFIPILAASFPYTKCVYSFLLFFFHFFFSSAVQFSFSLVVLQHRVHTAIIYRYSPPFRAVLCLDTLIQCLQNQAEAKSSFLYVWLNCCCWLVVRLCVCVHAILSQEMQLNSLLFHVFPISVHCGVCSFQ